jgi:uncharacterized membrane protein YhaH (DUF805 family)
MPVWLDGEAAMLTAVFSFRGRINRLQYFLGTLVIGGVLALLAAMVISFTELAPTSRPSLAMALDAVFLVFAAPLATWCAVSLQARRLRDIGWEPLVVMPMWLGILALGAIAASAGLALSQAPVASMISLAMLACLYGWPGRRNGVTSLCDGRMMALGSSPALAPIRRRGFSPNRRWR